MNKKEERKSRRSKKQNHFSDRRKKKQHHNPRAERQHNPKRRASNHRRMHRRGNMGREMEKRVLDICNRMVDGGAIVSVVYHEPNSPEDLSGRDFTVVMVVDGKEVEYSFGITISEGRKAALKQAKYRNYIPQWSLPWNVNDGTIQKKILELFNVRNVREEAPQEAPDETLREFLAGAA